MLISKLRPNLQRVIIPPMSFYLRYPSQYQLEKLAQIHTNLLIAHKDLPTSCIKEHETRFPY